MIIGAVVGVVVAAAIIITAPVSLPVIAAVGAVALGVGVGGAIHTGIKKENAQKEVKKVQEKSDQAYTEYAALQEKEKNGTLTAEEKEKMGKMASQIQQIEQQKRELCEKLEKFNKHSIIYENVSYLGLGLMAISFAPTAGPALVDAMAGSALASAVPVLGTTLGELAAGGLTMSGIGGTLYAGSNLTEAATGSNPIKDTFYQGREDEYYRDQGILNSINMMTDIAGGAQAYYDVKDWAKQPAAPEPSADGGGEGNGWDMPRGGDTINDRHYSEHALERMAPNTPEVRAEIHTRAMERAEAAGLQPGTAEYNTFINKQIDPRGIPPMVVEDAIRNTPAVPGTNPGTFMHQTPDVTVIVNSSGDVVTVIPKR